MYHINPAVWGSVGSLRFVFGNNRVAMFLDSEPMVANVRVKPRLTVPVLQWHFIDYQVTSASHRPSIGLRSAISESTGR